MIENVEQQKKNEEVVSFAISIFKVSQDWYFGKHTIELTSLAQSPNSLIKDEKGGEFQGRVVLEFRVERLEGESVSRCNVMDGWSPWIENINKGKLQTISYCQSHHDWIICSLFRYRYIMKSCYQHRRAVFLEEVLTEISIHTHEQLVLLLNL